MRWLDHRRRGRRRCSGRRSGWCGRGRGAGRGYLAIRIGGAGDDRRLRADGGDRHGADAGGAGAAGRHERVRVAHGDFVSGSGLCRALALPAPARSGATGAWVFAAWRLCNCDIRIRSVILQASFTSFLFLGAGSATYAWRRTRCCCSSCRSPPTRSTIAAEALVERGEPRPAAAAERGRRLAVGRGLLRGAGAGLVRWAGDHRRHGRHRPRCGPRRAPTCLGWRRRRRIGIAAWMLSMASSARPRPGHAQCRDRVGRSTSRRSCSSCLRWATMALWGGADGVNATRGLTLAVLSGAGGAGPGQDRSR